MKKWIWTVVIILSLAILSISFFGAFVILNNETKTEENDIHLKMESDITEFWEDYNITIRITNIGKSSIDLPNDGSSYFKMNIYNTNDEVFLDELVSRWNIDPVTGIYDKQGGSIDPGEEMKMNFTWFTGSNIYQIIGNETIVPYGVYKVVSELGISDEIFIKIIYIDHSPVIELAISGETIDGRGHVSVSLKNTRNYALDFELPYPGLTITSIFDSNGRIVGGGSRSCLCITQPVYIRPHQTIFDNMTFTSFWKKNVDPGFYHITSLCLATPIQTEAWIYFEG